MTQEVWKPIKGYESLYSVSNCGRVKSHKRSEAKILKNLIASTGYPTIFLSRSKVKTRFVHRLVAEAFLDNPQQKRTVNHKDGNKMNNHISNLEWCTHSENSLHANRAGLLRAIEMKPVIQLTTGGEVVKLWECAHDAKRELGFNQGNISACALGNRKTANGYLWKYSTI